MIIRSKLFMTFNIDSRCMFPRLHSDSSTLVKVFLVSYKTVMTIFDTLYHTAKLKEIKYQRKGQTIYVTGLGLVA